MAWNPNIPQAFDVMSDSQSDLLDDYRAINSFMNINHVDFNGADQGKHKYVQFPVQSSAPATLSTEVALFSRLATQVITTQVPTICFKNSSNGAVYEFGIGRGSTAGWARLPSGALMKWHRIIWPEAGFGSNDSTFTTSWPSDNQYPAFQTTPVFMAGSVVTLQDLKGPQATISAVPVGTTQYTVRVDGTFQLLGWFSFESCVFAIGT